MLARAGRGHFLLGKEPESLGVTDLFVAKQLESPREGGAQCSSPL